MEYKVLVGASPNLLETVVKLHIELGWSLMGGVSIAESGYGDTSFAQAVTKGD